MNAEQASKRVMWEATRLRLRFGEGRCCRREGVSALWETPERRVSGEPTGVVVTACLKEGTTGNTGSPSDALREMQPTVREDEAGPFRVAERPVVARNAGNAGGVKGP